MATPHRGRGSRQGKAIREADRAGRGPSAWKASAGRPRARALDPECRSAPSCAGACPPAVSTSSISCSSSDRAACRKAGSRVAARSAAVRLVRMSASEGPPFLTAPFNKHALVFARFFLPRGGKKLPLRPAHRFLFPYAKSILARPPSPCVLFTSRNGHHRQDRPMSKPGRRKHFPEQAVKTGAPMRSARSPHILLPACDCIAFSYLLLDGFEFRHAEAALLNSKPSRRRSRRLCSRTLASRMCGERALRIGRPFSRPFWEMFPPARFSDMVGLADDVRLRG